MKILEKEFTSKNFEYKQMVREGNLAIYRQKLIDSESEKFEVIVIDSHNGYEIAGNVIAPSEMYPCSTSWGVKGFTLLTYDDAMEKIKYLKKTRKGK